MMLAGKARFFLVRPATDFLNQPKIFRSNVMNKYSAMTGKKEDR
jgi:hypothetical protein